MKEDKELLAMQEIVKSLESLDKDARERVLGYIFSRLNIDMGISKRNHEESGIADSVPSVPPSPDLMSQNTVKPEVVHQTDIRSLKEQKNPATAVEMAVLVAYYLEDLAPQNERKSEVETSDITTYFKQAGYPLPKAPKMTLVHAKNAGYFESLQQGHFKLNPVGYNLAAHTMGKVEKKISKPRKRAVNKTAKKTAKKK